MSRNRISSKFRVRGLRVFVIGILLFSSLPSFSLAQEEYTYDSKGKRDPFIALVTPGGVLLTLDKEDVKTDLAVEGIIYDKQGSSYAIVNSEVVRVGDSTASGYQVLKIEDKKVIFIKEGSTREVPLKEDNP